MISNKILHFVARANLALFAKMAPGATRGYMHAYVYRKAADGRIREIRNRVDRTIRVLFADKVNLSQEFQREQYLVRHKKLVRNQSG